LSIFFPGPVRPGEKERGKKERKDRNNAGNALPRQLFLFQNEEQKKKGKKKKNNLEKPQTVTDVLNQKWYRVGGEKKKERGNPKRQRNLFCGRRSIGLQGKK